MLRNLLEDSPSIHLPQVRMQNNKEIKVFVIFLSAAHLMLGPCVISGAAAPTTGLTLGMFGVLWGIFKLKSF